MMSVYNKDNPKYLADSLRSILDQTIPCDEIVLVRDGPLNKELDDVIFKFTNEYKIIKVVSLALNSGLGNALNVGLANCRNELVARMDSDDISFPNRCEMELARFCFDPELVIVGTNICEFDGTIDNVVSSRPVPENYPEIVKFARRRSPFNHPTVMYKKSKVIACGGYSVLRRKEDLSLFPKMVNEGCKSYNIQKPLLYYRATEDNLRRRTTWVNCSEYISVIFSNYKKGYCSLFDVLYVICGQIALYILPISIVKKLTSKYLRTNNR